jgi:ABC-type sulfate transport system permease component
MLSRNHFHLNTIIKKTLLLNMTILTFYLLIFLFLLHLELQHIQEKIDDLMKVLEDTNNTSSNSKY